MSENKMHGQIQIADEVVGVIAVTAALEVEGVVAGSHHGKGITEFFGKKGHTKCVKVATDENEAVVDMEIIVKFGTKVKSTVETMTGLNVAVVNVSISGVVKEVKAEEE